LPAQLALAHKTGTSDTFDGRTGATNDAGIVTLPDGRVIVVVAFLQDSPANDAERDATLANVARAVADAYVP
jgi:beta-lactamase class A